MLIAIARLEKTGDTVAGPGSISPAAANFIKADCEQAVQNSSGEQKNGMGGKTLRCTQPFGSSPLFTSH